MGMEDMDGYGGWGRGWVGKGKGKGIHYEVCRMGMKARNNFHIVVRLSSRCQSCFSDGEIII